MKNWKTKTMKFEPNKFKYIREPWFLALLIISIAKLVIHLYANGNYGFHRDELLHLAVSEHLDWGYMEFPPLIALIGRIEQFLFGGSLLSIRLFPALVGVSLVWIAGLMAKEMKGKNLAIILAGVCVFAAHSYYRNHTLFQPVAFDQLFWTLGYYWILRYINTEDKIYLLLMGITAGLGLMNKYSMVFWGAGIAIGFLFYHTASSLHPSKSPLIKPCPQAGGGRLRGDVKLNANHLLNSIYKRGSLYSRKWIWVSAIIAFLIFLPNLLWQYQNNFPVLDHIKTLYNTQLNERSKTDFLISQIFSMNIFAFPVWILGLYFFLFSKKLNQYRIFGVAYLVSGLLLLFFSGKAYYLYAVYPIMFAGGAVALESILKGKYQLIGWGLGLALIYNGLIYMPYGTPFLPIEKFAEYAGLEKNSEGRLEGLTGDYADMFGWEEQVALVDSIYQTLSGEEKKNCIIWAENYGEAGALNYLGRKYNLPKPVCKHGSFWLRGPGSNNGEIAVSIGNEKNAVEFFFEETILIKMIKHPYAIDEENNIPLYLCRKPKITLKEYWPKFEEHIFD